MTALPTIISREDAREEGLSWYFTGEPCKRGHVVERYVAYKDCVECRREQKHKRYAANPEKFQERARKRYAANPEKFREVMRKLRAADPDKFRERNRKDREDNPERFLEYRRKAHEADPEKARTYNRQYSYTKQGRLRAFWKMIKQRMGLKRGARQKLLAYSPEKFQAHLISTLSVAMTYQEACDANYQHDHIVPISYISKNFPFDIACKMVVDLDNIRFIPVTENMQKNSKMGEPYQLEVLDILKDRYL